MRLRARGSSSTISARIGIAWSRFANVSDVSVDSSPDLTSGAPLDVTRDKSFVVPLRSCVSSLDTVFIISSRYSVELASNHGLAEPALARRLVVPSPSPDTILGSSRPIPSSANPKPQHRRCDCAIRGDGFPPPYHRDHFSRD